MADQTGERPTAEFEFLGRTIHVHMPTPEQLLVWQRTLEQMGRAQMAGWNGAQAMNALGRCRKIIDTVIVLQMDKDWLDDEMLEGRLGLMGILPLMTQAIEAFVEAGNREERRAVKKVGKKAVRKSA